MPKINIIFLIISCLFFVSCSSSYEFLSKNSLNPTDEFSKYLLIEYKNKADFEALKMHDWNSTKLYSEKAIKAASGQKIKPEKIKNWNISESDINKLEKAHENLLKIYEKAIKIKPYDLAVAISSLDCWGEQLEERWQIWDINSCKNDYLKAMHNIYLALSDEKNNTKDIKIDNQESESVVVVTKNKKNEVKQIIYFDFDKSNLSIVSLNEIKNFLKKNKSIITKYLIVGHTDTKGTKEYNKKLSFKRAVKIQEILIKLGIDINDTKIVARGESDLAIQTSDEIAHPANRRAEISKIN